VGPLSTLSNVSDFAGNFRYEKAFGYRSLKEPSNSDPMPLDATMWLASCTKLMGTIAVMQCVELGLLNLDDDTSPILPELGQLQILKGFEQDPDRKDMPILVKNMKAITLRCVFSCGRKFRF
jgi:CubicO group peptidase (beta-lactamase class C family)